MKEDVVCLFQGASKPTIIRFCEDHWTIIIIAATPPPTIPAESGEVEWSRYLQNVDRLRIRRLRCSWNWNKSPGNMLNQEEHNAARGSSDHVRETWNSALVSGDSEKYEKAEREFQEVMSYYETAPREEGGIKFLIDLLSFTHSVDLDLMNERYDRPSLLWAAEKGYEAVVGFLIGRLNANVNFRDKIGQTALQAAAEGGYLTVVERLLQKKADVNAAATNYGRKALQAAAEGGHFAVVERLLQEKADVNAEAATDYGRTTLQAAAGGGHLAVVE
jgi:hypothetical protein